VVAVTALDPSGSQLPFVQFSDGRMILSDSTIRIESMGYDDENNITELTIENRSGVTIYGPLHFIVDEILPGIVTLVDPDGTTGEGKSYVNLTGLLTLNKIEPNEKIKTNVLFNCPGHTSFSLSCSLNGFTAAGKSLTARSFGNKLGFLESWQMKQGDIHQTGRADFSVPSHRLNDTFFDVTSWQTPTPGNANEGNLGGTSMTFYDGAGPDGADIICGTYHWPIGIQGMDRHTGEVFWYGNPDGGEEIAEMTPAFSNNGATLYVVNRYTDGNNPLMGFDTVSGPLVFRHNGLDAAPDNLGYGSPIIGPDGRIFLHGYYDRPHGGTDNGSSITETWTAADDTGTLKSDAVLYQDGDILKIVGSGRFGYVKCFNGQDGSPIWSVHMNCITDASVTIDPSNGNVYVPGGDNDIYVAGLDKEGNPLWSAASILVYDHVDGTNNPQRAQSTGCLSHDGTTFYFQTTSEQGDGQLYAINTSNGTTKWVYDTQSRAIDSWNQLSSSPIVTQNNVIIIGNNDGDTYYAIQDIGTSGKMLDMFTVDTDGNARASATLSSAGQLYLPVRTQWAFGNGSGDVPDNTIQNLYAAFDIEGRLPVPGIATFAEGFGKTTQGNPGDLDKDGDVDGKDMARLIDNL